MREVEYDLFNCNSGLRLTARETANELSRFMLAEPECRYKLTIGTDSLRLSDGRADFVTAVVVHRIGRGGKYFWRRLELGIFHNLRDRIIKEVLLSLEVATHILEELKKQSAPDFEFEIHADIGEHGPTKAMLQEVAGMIRAYNFEARTKPDSYAATSVADKLV